MGISFIGFVYRNLQISAHNNPYLCLIPTPEKYIPIDCNFYDRIEAAIVQRRIVRLEYRDAEGQATSAETKLQDTQTKAGEEFLLLPSGEQIRMDRILSLDGVPVPKSC